MSKIDPKNWKISLSVFAPDAVLDNSTIQEYARCPRRGLYKYGMRRGFIGNNFAIQYGLAYHKYREVVEKYMFANKCKMSDEVHSLGVDAAIAGWVEPPIGHKKEYLGLQRLATAVKMARVRIESEQRTGDVVITRPEEAFDLELPFWLCGNCGWANINPIEPENVPSCARCGSTIVILPRHGGRVDQFIQYKALGDAQMVRDFKTTGQMGDYYAEKFDPNAQLQSYTWAGEMLSGRKFDGALIETIYNTKTQGPVITQTYKTYTEGQQMAWLASNMMERQFIQTMWARKEELGYLAFPQRTNACQDFGGCHFRQACRASGAWEIEDWMENNTIYSHWDFTNPDAEESGV